MGALVTLSSLWGAVALAASPDAAPVQVYPTNGPITIDGVLDEPGWAAATPVTDFLKYTPIEGGAPPGITEVRFLQDERTLYVGVTVRDTGYPIRARLSPREEINDDDQIGIYLDTFDDERSGYIFYLNAIGIQQDLRMANGTWSVDWNTVFLSKGTVDGDSYSLEIAFPFRSLRFTPGGEPQQWGLILTRKIPAEGAKYAFPDIARGHPQLFSQSAPLQGVRPPSRAAGLELLPVMAVGQDGSREVAGDRLDWSGFDPWSDAIHPGLDARIGLTPDTGLAATINPDFSQVEGDATQIELNQRFAFYYPEQRPFFLDGIDAFQDRQDTLYTRSIVEPIYGVKVSGREGAFSFGALNALDLSPGASVHEEGALGFSEEELADAWAVNSFLRGRMDAFQGGYVGLTVADKRPVLPGEGATGAFNDVWGADLQVPLGERWLVDAHSSWSLIGDGDGERALGWSNGAEIARSSGIGAGFNASVQDTSAEYRKEMGFFTQSGRTSASSGFNYTFEPGWVNTLTPGISARYTSERSGDSYQGATASLAAVRGVRDGRVSASVFEIDQDGVVVPGWALSGGYSSNPSRLLRLMAFASHGSELDYSLLVPATATRMSGTLTLRPGAAVRLDTTVQQQWFTPEGDDLSAASALRSRLTWQFSPTWGLRLIGEGRLGDDTPELDTSAMFTWIRHPGTEAYIGASQSFDAAEGMTDLTMFAKLSWLFRL